MVKMKITHTKPLKKEQTNSEAKTKWEKWHIVHLAVCVWMDRFNLYEMHTLYRQCYTKSIYMHVMHFFLYYNSICFTMYLFCFRYMSFVCIIYKIFFKTSKCINFTCCSDFFTLVGKNHLKNFVKYEYTWTMFLFLFWSSMNLSKQLKKVFDCLCVYCICVFSPSLHFVSTPQWLRYSNDWNWN